MSKTTEWILKYGDFPHLWVGRKDEKKSGEKTEAKKKGGGDG